MHFKTRTPKGDGNAVTHSNYFFIANVISKREPRKGTETNQKELVEVMYKEVISKREPRKGTETSSLRRTTNSSTTSSFQNANPERGRKLRNTMFRPRFNRISKREPRKGTETTSTRGIFAEREPAFQNANPERGRKRSKSFAPKHLNICNFKTRTPKGDGNCGFIYQGRQPG